MTGLKLTIPTTFTDPTLPYLRDDPVLPKQGAMMLIDPMHPAGTWDAGVPADGAYLPNIAESQALALFGSGNDAKPKLKKPAAFTGTAGLLERTSKGGLHGIVSQILANVPNQVGPVLAFSNAMVKYVLDNPTHDYYVDVWARLTRIPVAAYNNSSVVAFNGNGQQTNSYLFNLAPSGAVGTNWAQRPNATPPFIAKHEDPAGSALGNKFYSIATENWRTATAGLESSLPGDGTNTAITGQQAGAGLPFGPAAWNGIGATGTTTETGVFTPPGSATGSNKEKCDSHIIYRFYMEDLTVSGRTYAEIDALSWAEYQKHVLTAGGRYYDDTFTDPATIP